VKSALLLRYSSNGIDFSVCVGLKLFLLKNSLLSIDKFVGMVGAELNEVILTLNLAKGDSSTKELKFGMLELVFSAVQVVLSQKMHQDGLLLIGKV